MAQRDLPAVPELQERKEQVVQPVLRVQPAQQESRAHPVPRVQAVQPEF